MANWAPWDQACVLNCDESTDRLAKFRADWMGSRILSRVECFRVRARPAREFPRPSWWRPDHTGYPGSADRYWAVRRSMMEIVERALVDGVNHLLICEDDAYPTPMFDDVFPRFFAEMPDDWIGYKLFAFHGRSPDLVSQNCGRLLTKGGTGGTQALGLNRTGMQAWHDAAWRDIHCLYDQFVGQYADGRMYAPVPYLFGERDWPSVAKGLAQKSAVDANKSLPDGVLGQVGTSPPPEKAAGDCPPGVE